MDAKFTALHNLLLKRKPRLEKVSVINSLTFLYTYPDIDVSLSCFNLSIKEFTSAIYCRSTKTKEVDHLRY